MSYVNKSYSHDAGLHRYGRRGAMIRRKRGLSGLGSLGDDACTPYGAVMQPDGTCQVAIAGPGSNTTIMTGSGPAVAPQNQASGSSWFDSLMKGFANVTTPAQQPMPVAQASGISTTTLVIGGVALVGVALLLKSRR